MNINILFCNIILYHLISIILLQKAGEEIAPKSCSNLRTKKKKNLKFLKFLKNSFIAERKEGGAQYLFKNNRFK